jgi:hypothetical protein
LECLPFDLLISNPCDVLFYISIFTEGRLSCDVFVLRNYFASVGMSKKIKMLLVVYDR